MGSPDIIQSPNDKKCYKFLKLSNGMAVLLIHDPAVAEALTIAEVSNTITATTSSSPISGALS
jgi:secreted Zn-dependent insulinase-like peptidase